jgi:hypothetical protein
MSVVVDRIGVVEASRLVKSNSALFVCAYDDELKFRKFQLDGAISLSALRKQEATLDKNREIIFYCA